MSAAARVDANRPGARGAGAPFREAERSAGVATKDRTEKEGSPDLAFSRGPARRKSGDAAHR
jgi:hypothetical protein